VGWRDSWRRLFGKPAEPVQSAPEPLEARGRDVPFDVPSHEPSSGSPGAGTSTVELPKPTDKPLGAGIDLLKPNHRRRALRDPRLVPRSKSTRLPLWLVGLFSFRSPARTPGRFEEGEIRRLCSPTMRTRNSVLRDLVADEAQLARHGLPLWRTEDDVAKALGIPLKQLRFFAIHREAALQSHYVTFTIPKRSGMPRMIVAPKRRLKQLQRRLLDLLIRKLPVSEHAHGFQRGRSIVTSAAPHVGRAVVLTMDLKDFFPSVTFARIRGLLVALGYGYRVATTLAVLTTEAERQPSMIKETTYLVATGQRYCVQGAPTSPGLCNAIALRLDRRLSGLAAKLGFSYTRYADDLTFSGDDAGCLPALKRLAKRIIEEEGFRLNEAKTRIMRRGCRQSVVGVTVNDVAGLSRQERRRLRAMIHQTNKESANPAVLARIRGKLAFLAMLNTRQAASMRKTLDHS
jgi:RNA-directed DNA polymerase